MKPLELDIEVARIIKSLRQENRIKQITMADALNMKLSNYCKLEGGYRGITIGQLDNIAKVFKTTLVQLLVTSRDFIGNRPREGSFIELMLNLFFIK